jgi:cytochrome c oxidase subunit IV
MILRRHVWRLWKGPVVVWLILLVLLAASTAAAYWPLGAWNAPINLVIAAVMVGLIVTFLMGLRSSTALIHVVAAAGIFWSVFMFSLTFADYWTRAY